MGNIKIALTEKRKTECDNSIFPKDYYDIPEVNEFQNIFAVRNYAYKVLESYAGQQVDVILNGGLSIEILCVIQVAAKLGISLCVLHYDREKDIYVSQKITWNFVSDNMILNEKNRQAYEKIKKERKDSDIERFILCLGRHCVEDNQYPTIFEIITVDKIFDFSWQEEQVEKVLKKVMKKQIFVYLTGLTQMILSVLNVAYRLGISIIFLHYDVDTEEYFPQNMDEF